MGLNVKVGSFNIGTGAAGTTTVISGIGFQPKAIIFWWTGRTESTKTAGGASVRRGLGFATSSTDFRAIACGDDDGVGTAQAAQGRRDDACILEVADLSGATLVGWADVQSMDAGGFTLEILDAFTTNLRVHYMAFGGTDIDAEIVTWTPAGTAPTAQTVSTTNVPKALFNMGTRQTTANVAGLNATYSWGFGISTSASYSWGGGGLDATGTGAGFCGALMGEFITARPNTGTSVVAGMPDMRATLTSLNSSPTGFTVQWLERATTSLMDTLVLSGTFKVDVGSFNTTTTTGAINKTGIAFQPTAVMFCSHGKVAEATDTFTAHERLSIGATDGTTQECLSYVCRSSNTTMFNSTSVAFDVIYQSLVETNDLASGGLQAEASFNNFTSDGFSIQMSDADVVTALVGYIAFAPGANNYVLTASEGSVGITGANAGVYQGRVLTASPGAVSVAGVNASLLFKRLLSASAGAVAVTGVNASLNKGNVVGASIGVIPITGENASLLRGLLVSAQVGAIPITGVNATFNRGQLLSAQPGAVDINGVNANLKLAALLTAQTGSLGIAGINASLLRGGMLLTAQAGSLGITGINATLSITLLLSASPGAVPLTGVNANLLAVRLLSANGGVINIAGVAATLSVYTPQAYVLTAQPGAWSIVGIDAMLTRGRPFTLLPGAVSITGNNATLYGSFRILGDSVLVPILGTEATLIGVEPGGHSTDLIPIALDELRHYIES